MAILKCEWVVEFLLFSYELLCTVHFDMRDIEGAHTSRPGTLSIPSERQRSSAHAFSPGTLRIFQIDREGAHASLQLRYPEHSFAGTGRHQTLVGSFCNTELRDSKHVELIFQNKCLLSLYTLVFFKGNIYLKQDYFTSRNASD